MQAIDPHLDTLPKLLLHNAAALGSRPAMRHKDLGIWQTWTWAQMLEEVRAFSVGLAELGLKRGDKFTIVGSNRPRLYWAMCAGQALGAVPVPVYADAVADEMAFVLAHAEVTLGRRRGSGAGRQNNRRVGSRCRCLGKSFTTSRAG